MPRKASNIAIKEIKTVSEWRAIYPLIRQLNPDITRPRFDQLLKSIRAQGSYRCVGAYRGKKLVGTLGIWTGTRFWCGKYMEADNVVVDQKLRNAGIGRALFKWLDKEAKRLNCDIVMADSYTRNHASHRFYFRERYVILGYCFVKKVKN
jgi:GNAT superfamily N-acetyltransferase